MSDLSVRKHIAQLVRNYMRDHDLNQNDISRMTGINYRTVSTLLTEKNTPRIETLDPIRRILRITWDEMIGE